MAAHAPLAAAGGCKAAELQLTGALCAMYQLEQWSTCASLQSYAAEAHVVEDGNPLVLGVGALHDACQTLRHDAHAVPLQQLQDGGPVCNIMGIINVSTAWLRLHETCTSLCTAKARRHN